jgi:hypothetical protein
VTAPAGGRLIRLVLLALAVLALLGGLTGAWTLVGLQPAGPSSLAADHGPLMALGFLATLIALERAVALGRWWGFAAPLLAALGAVAWIAGAPIATGALAQVAGGLALVAIYAAFLRIDRSLHAGVQVVGALAWVGAAGMLAAGSPVSRAVPWMAGFLVPIIVGERLELSRLGRPPHWAASLLAAAVFLLVVGLLAGEWTADGGARLVGLALAFLALWLLRFDLARRTIRASDLPRFVAACLLPGYGWLLLAGLLWLVGGWPSGALYDAALHAIFLGFVVSMVFGHAPIILPSVLGHPLPYHPRFYGHLVLLHLGLVLRVASDLLMLAIGSGTAARQAWVLGGLLNIVSILVFLGSSVLAMAGAATAGRARSFRRGGADRATG